MSKDNEHEKQFTIVVSLLNFENSVEKILYELRTAGIINEKIPIRPIPLLKREAKRDRL